MKFTLILLMLVVVALFATSRYFARAVEARFPPTGAFADINGTKLHYTDHAAGDDADLLPMVFIHGASGNLRDLEAPISEALKGRGRMIFIDRPGHGYSTRGDEMDIHLPWGQAGILSGLLERLEIKQAIIIGHSLGGSTAAAFAVNHPEQAAGLVFLAPATHPWPGAGVTWHYEFTELPMIGWLFSELLAIPAGQLLYKDGVKGVFTPQKLPKNYEELSATRLVLRPDVFRHNAEDVTSLYDAVVEFSPRYNEISAPTSIITGDSDDVVLANIHSKGLEADIKGSRLIWLEGVGHSPIWTNTDTVVSEIERVSAEATAQR